MDKNLRNEMRHITIAALCIFFVVFNLTGCAHQLSYEEAEQLALEYYGGSFHYIEKETHITKLTGYSDGRNMAFCFTVSEIDAYKLLSDEPNTFRDCSEVVVLTPLKDGTCSKDDYAIEDFVLNYPEGRARGPILYETYQQLLKNYTYRREYTEEECNSFSQKYIKLTEHLLK